MTGPRRRAGVLALGVVLALVPALAIARRPPKKPDAAATPRRSRDEAHGRSGRKAPPKPATHCKEPDAVNADLAAGLDFYAQGKWSDASARLGAWAQSADAGKDPAAGRGYYALAYAVRMTGHAPEAEGWLAKAQPLLEARLASDPTLEAYYYLAAIHDGRHESAAVADLVAQAGHALDAGLCPDPDGDDYFRQARLMGFVGRNSEGLALMQRASDAYVKGRGRIGAYHAQAERTLGEQLLADQHDSEALQHFQAAAALDPGVPNIHREIGLVLLRQGDVKGAADYWRTNWKRERQNGNDLTYAVPVLDKIVRYREKFGDKNAVGDQSDVTTAAIEQNAKKEGNTFLQLMGEKAEAVKAGKPFPPEKEEAMAVADYRMAQFLREYIQRGQDLPEFALQNGLLPAIHNRGLPQRNSG